MMEFSLFLISLLSLGAVLGGVILGAIALAHIKALTRRVKALEEGDGVRLATPPSQPSAADEVASIETDAAREEWPPRSAAAEVSSSPPLEEAATPQGADPAPASQPNPAPRRRIEWERLLGVRGAAILGGVALVIAALFFYQYAVQEGWFDARMRVLTGAVVGTLCLFFQGPLRARGYGIVANVLAGSGAAVHYAAAWAGFRLFEMLPFWAGFGWMIVTTVACCALALRHSAQLIAVFGLVGGFATPLLLSTSDASAVSLFGYVLVLDLALLAMGRRQDWPWLGLLGLFGTTGIQILWLLDGHTEEAAAGLAACGVFGLLFVAFGGNEDSPFRVRWLLGRIAGVMIPFGIALHYATLVELGEDFWMVAAVAALLACAATFVGRRMELAALPIAAAAGAAALSATWVLSSDLASDSLVDFALLTGATALCLAVFDAWPRRARPKDLHPSAAYSLLVLFAVTWVVGWAMVPAYATAGKVLPFWPICLGIGIHLAFAVCARAALPALPVLAGLAAGINFAVLNGSLAEAALVSDAVESLVGTDLLSLFIAPLTAGALLLLAVVWRAHPAPRALALAAVCCAVLPMLDQDRPWEGASLLQHHVPLLLAICVGAAAAARCGSSIPTAVVVLFTGTTLYAFAGGGDIFRLGWTIPEVLPWLLAGTAATTLAPVLFRGQLARTSLMGLVAATSVFMGFGDFALDRWVQLFEHAWGDRWIGIVPLILALPAGLAALCLRGDHKPDGVRSARTAYIMVACLLCALALPLQVDSRQLGGVSGMWGWIGLALGAGLWAWLAQRRSSPLWSLAAMVAVAIAAAPWCLPLRLIGVTESDIRPFSVPDAFEPQEALLLNGFTYAYGLVFAALLAVLRFSAAPIARPDGSGEGRGRSGVIAKAVTGLQEWLTVEGGLWRPRAFLRGVVGALACLVPFIWVNVLVVNRYGEGEHLVIEGTNLNRDLALSLAWALYSFTLLALGTRRGIVALRWVSLAFLLATISKVFLVDLANLEGLQRVGSFLGLALCLILVSLFYQRFVFGRDAGD